MKLQKILITGGTSFVGKHLQDELDGINVKYYVFSKSEYDLTKKDQADAVFSSHKDSDVIVHLACLQAAADFPAKHPAEQFYINNLIHCNVLEAWRRFLPEAKFFGIGSSCAYSGKATALTEEKFMDGEIHGSVYSYAFTKRLLYTGIMAYNDQYNLNGSYLIPATMYGEYDDFHIETAHVCGALISKFVKAVREGIPVVEIWGDGTQVREFMYVKDFIRALLHLIPLCDRDIVNVGPGKGMSIKDLANEVSQATGFEGKLFFNSDYYVGVKEKVMNTSKLTQKYNWKVPNDLSGGIKRTVVWYARNYDKLRNKRKFS